MAMSLQRLNSVFTSGLLLCFLLSVVRGACADEGVRRALIICGHPGNAEYRTVFVENINRIRTALTTTWTFSDEAIQILFGTVAMQQDGEPVPDHSDRPATLDDLRAIVKDVQQTLKPEDSLWIMIIGHAYFDGRHAWLNLAGPDPNETDLGQIFQDLHCRECVFWLTTSLSGRFVRPLARTGRVIISATDVSGESESTLFPTALERILSHPPKRSEFDIDQSGDLSLLDLYLAIYRDVAQQYLQKNILLTEHAQLEDNGDGRGREVQQYYFPEELGGRLRPGAKPVIRQGEVDGARAAGIRLNFSEKE